MHGFILDTVIDADHGTAEALALRVARMLAERDDVRRVDITLRCDADVKDNSASILDG